MDHIPVGLDNYLNRQDETDKVLFKIKEQDKIYIGGYINLEDVKNEKVGKLVVLKDVTIQHKAVNNYILLVLMAGTLLFLFVMTIVAKYVSFVSRKLAYYHRELEDAAYIDPLTGIGNRRYLLEKADMFFADNPSGVIILVDLDHFKQVNDRYSHDVGDDVLKGMCQTVSGYIRQDDIFARYGGEEFVILLPRCELDIALIKAEAIRHAVESMETIIKSGILQVSVSMGVYEIQKGDSFQNTIKCADIALYQAKENSRNCIEVYSKRRITKPDERPLIPTN
jgi:diguanylate cyclase (GGDEF)-like protein